MHCECVPAFLLSPIIPILYQSYDTNSTYNTQLIWKCESFPGKHCHTLETPGLNISLHVFTDAFLTFLMETR